MAESDEGIVQAGVRTKWRSEAHDFTPWLAENLHLLGDEIGMTLELVQMEKPIGPFSLDILAKESNSGERVAIENQLEGTDHSHLGQLLTYAAGCEAKVAIWVAPDFVYQHAEALHRLNEWTSQEVRFYGVKVEVTRRAGDSGLEPRLRTVVYPGGWNKAFTVGPDEAPWPIQRTRDFFQPLIAKLMGSDMRFADSHLQCWSYTDRFFPSGFNRDIGYTVDLGEDYAWVYLHIRTWDSIDLNNKLFDALKDDQKDIESSIDAQAEWHWDRFDSYSFSVVGIRKSASIDDPPEQLDETRAWMLDLLPKFKAVFEPRVARMLDDLRQAA